jgi:hypothetical protein
MFRAGGIADMFETGAETRADEAIQLKSGDASKMK